MAAVKKRNVKLTNNILQALVVSLTDKRTVGLSKRLSGYVVFTIHWRPLSLWWVTTNMCHHLWHFLTVQIPHASLQTDEVFNLIAKYSSRNLFFSQFVDQIFSEPKYRFKIRWSVSPFYGTLHNEEMLNWL